MSGCAFGVVVVVHYTVVCIVHEIDDKLKIVLHVVNLSADAVPNS
jgi:hypothetical protein